MKKSLLNIMFCCCLLMLLTGCGEKNTELNKENKNTTTKTTQKLESSKAEVEEVLESDTSINFATYVTTNHDLVVVALNTSGENKDIKITAEFKDAHLNTLARETEVVYSVLPSKEISVVIDDDHDWATVDVLVTSEESDKISYGNAVKYTHKDTGKDIEIEISNSIKDTVDVLDFSVAFLNKDGELVGVSHSNELSIESDAKGTVEIDYPRDERNRKIEFETYKVYLNEAYSNKK